MPGRVDQEELGRVGEVTEPPTPSDATPSPTGGATMYPEEDPMTQGASESDTVTQPMRPDMTEDKESLLLPVRNTFTNSLVTLLDYSDLLTIPVYNIVSFCFIVYLLLQLSLLNIFLLNSHCIDLSVLLFSYMF